MKCSRNKRFDRKTRRCVLKKPSKRHRYKITYTDPSDPKGMRVKTWGFKSKSEANKARKDLAVVWDVNPKTIGIQKSKKKHPSYF